MSKKTRKIADQVALSDSIRLGMRNYFSSQFLWTARHMAAAAAAIEDAHSGESKFDIEHRAYVLSSISASGFFLEAAINEVYQDAHDEYGLTGDGYLASLEPRTAKAMAESWRATNEGKSLGAALGKWQLLPIFADREPLDRGAAPYQDAEPVIKLRNVLAHSRSELVWADEEHRLEEQLKGKFPPNRLMEGAGNPWWPSHCLGAGCAEWAYRSVLALADRVSDELGLRLNYRHLRESG